MSSDRAREIRIQTARELEQRGYVDKAVALFVKAGAPGEAARLLVSKERYADAGRLMLDTLAVLPEDVGRLEGSERQAAVKAARCFALGGDTQTASRLLRALGLEGGGAEGGRPSMPPDVLPPTAPRSSMPPGSPGTEPPRVAAPAPSTNPSVTMPPQAREVSRPSVTMPAQPATPSLAPAPAAPQRHAFAPPARGSAPSMPAAPAAAAVPRERAVAITPSPTPAATSEKWGRASGWRSGHVDSSTQDLAIQQLLDQGMKNQAARVAWDAGRLEDAARWFAEMGSDYETGAVLYDLGRLEPAMEALLRVSPEHKRHRIACAKLIDLADRLDRFDFELDRILTRFAKAPPIEAAETPMYLRLADLYGRHGFPDGARQVLELILLFDPSHDGARAALQRLGAPQDKLRSRAPAPLVPARAGSPLRALPPLPSLEEFVAEARRHAPAQGAISTAGQRA